jgi:hypothetical protein
MAIGEEEEMILHPFLWIAKSARKAVFWVLAVLAVLTGAALQTLAGPLKTAVSPSGIISFELAGNLSKIESILSTWGPVGKMYAGLNLGLDYLFIGAYVGAIGLACALLGGSLVRRVRLLGLIGTFLAWALLLAGALDCLENFALIKLLLGSEVNTLAIVARLCAIPKFVIILAGIGYVIVGLLRLLALGKRGHIKSAA